MLKKILEYITNSCYHIIKIGAIRSGDMNKYSALDIAKWFIWKNHIEQIENITDDDNYEVYEGITHLKLQKLLYYADGINLAINNEPLFNEKIYAWTHGPVVKDVYSFFAVCGRHEINFNGDWLEDVKKITEDEKVNEILELTYDNFGGFTAWQLREKSHVVGGPWQQTVDTIGMDNEISNNLIQDYFKKHIVNCE